MASSLSHLINNFGEEIRKIKCKNEQNNIKCETLGIKYKHCNFFLEHTRFKMIQQDANLYVLIRYIKKRLMKT